MEDHTGDYIRECVEKVVLYDLVNIYSWNGGLSDWKIQIEYRRGVISPRIRSTREKHIVSYRRKIKIEKFAKNGFTWHSQHRVYILLDHNKRIFKHNKHSSPGWETQFITTCISLSCHVVGWQTGST